MAFKFRVRSSSSLGLFALSLCLTMAAAPKCAFADDKWQAAIPKPAERPEEWIRLMPELVKHHMDFGALAGARDMLAFFSDLQSKELAFKTIVDLADRGLPTPVKNDFVAGDIDPGNSDSFAQSYLLYKGMVNVDKKMDKWADYYFNKINKESFPKYLFYRATVAYSTGDLQQASQLLHQALGLTTGNAGLSLAKKEARTLARIHYELGEFEKSSEIYEQFLLKIAPVNPSDWLEEAWNLYQLKKYPEALGMIYNLESESASTDPLLEKYILRSLIYREFCLVGATDQLIKKFNSEFGATIDGIKLGEPLSNFPLLIRIDLPEARTYRQYAETLENLTAESAQISSLPSAVRPLASFVYTSEISMLKRLKQVHEDHALEALARHIVILGESLRFLKFDVQRERFNPDRVFAEKTPLKSTLVDSSDDNKNFRLHWQQWGDYWRDERQLYLGQLKNKCAQ
jgi:tetratricopeptide (TPR) repeat protein